MSEDRVVDRHDPTEVQASTLAAAAKMQTGRLRPSRVRTDYAEREAAKHVESFGVDLWIRVQFPAPPPLHIANLQLPIANLTC